MENKIYNLSRDVFFKATFSRPQILADFLSAYLGYSIFANQIEYLSVETLDPILKNSRYDIYALVKSAHEKTIVRLNLEMQGYNEADLECRMISYESRIILDDLVSEGYNLNKCISLWIFSFIPRFLNNKDTWIKKYNIKDENNNILNTNFEIAAILLPNIQMCPIIELKDIGISFFENNKEKLLSYSYKTEFGRKVALMLDELNKDIALKTEAWKNEMDERARQSELKHAKELAKKEGRAEGVKEGKEEGILENKKEVVINLFNMGMDIYFISKATNLSEIDIEKIIKSK